jgi:biopolymer transport protein ExbD
VSAPVSVGIFRPTVLLPESLIQEMPPEQLRPILLHELAHVRWHDYAVNLLQRFAEAILFFHPFVHLMNRSLRRMREEMCDIWVLSRSPKATVYARALTALAEKCLTPRKSLVGVGLFQQRARLRQRIERILACASPLSTRFRFGTALTLLAFSLVTVGGLSLTTLSARAVHAEEEKPSRSGEEGLPAEHAGEFRLPRPGEMKDVTEPTEIVIDVTKDGKYLVDRVERPIEDIEDMLKRTAELHPRASIILKGERETPYRDIVRVLDACREADLRNISFAVKPRGKESDREIEAATIDFLEAQVKQYQDKVRASSEALAKFKGEYGLQLGSGTDDEEGEG